MVSHRRRKREAASRDLSLRELELVELVEELLESVRWQQILGYSNQFLLDRHLKLDPAERDKVLEAAVRAVDKDAKLHEWHERLGQLKGERLRIHRAMQRARKDIEQGRPAPTPPGRDGDADERVADGDG